MPRITSCSPYGSSAVNTPLRESVTCIDRQQFLLRRRASMAHVRMHTRNISGCVGVADIAILSHAHSIQPLPHARCQSLETHGIRRCIKLPCKRMTPKNTTVLYYLRLLSAFPCREKALCVREIRASSRNKRLTSIAWKPRRGYPSRIQRPTQPPSPPRIASSHGKAREFERDKRRG